MEIRVFSTFYCVRFFFPPWDWKKRQLLVVCFDANVGYCRGATGDGDTVRDLAAAPERMLSRKRTQFHSRDAKKRPKRAALRVNARGGPTFWVLPFPAPGPEHFVSENAESAVWSPQLQTWDVSLSSTQNARQRSNRRRRGFRTKKVVSRRS